jgi:hypothetical protein
MAMERAALGVLCLKHHGVPLREAYLILGDWPSACCII